MDSISSTGSSTGQEKPRARGYQLLDCARLLAVIFIVWLHTPESRELAYTAGIGGFAVSFFTFASLFLAFQSALRHPENSIASYVKSRFVRIYLVFVAWSVFYGAVRLVSDLILKSPMPHMSLGLLLWNGTAHQLWFLPFIFMASSLSYAVARWSSQLRAAYWLIAAIFAIGGLVLAFCHAPNSFRGWGYTFELSGDASPSVLLALAFAMIYARTPPEFFSKNIMTIAGVLLWLVGIVLLSMWDRQIFLQTISGLGLMIASLNRSSTPLIERIACWGKFAFAIYLLHVLFLEGFQDILRKIGWPLSWQNDVITFFVTLICCAVAIFFLNKNDRMRKLLL